MATDQVPDPSRIRILWHLHRQRRRGFEATHTAAFDLLQCLQRGHAALLESTRVGDVRAYQLHTRFVLAAVGERFRDVEAAIAALNQTCSAPLPAELTGERDTDQGAGGCESESASIP